MICNVHFDKIHETLMKPGIIILLIEILVFMMRMGLVILNLQLLIIELLVGDIDN